MPGQGGWYGLLAIRDEILDAYREDAKAPVACPNDGEPLSSGPHGELFCKWGDYQYTGGGQSAG